MCLIESFLLICYEFFEVYTLLINEGTSSKMNKMYALLQKHGIHMS